METIIEPRKLLQFNRGNPNSPSLIKIKNDDLNDQDQSLEEADLTKRNKEGKTKVEEADEKRFEKEDRVVF
jgi:hypothetical protein